MCFNLAIFLSFDNREDSGAALHAVFSVRRDGYNADRF
jgi:hypothetical protein